MVRGNKMRVVTLWMNEVLLQGLQELVGRGMYASIGEAIREAVRELLKRELQAYNTIMIEDVKLKVEDGGIHGEY